MKTRKRFGQHFLQDTRILQQMLHAIAPLQTDHLVEIGPGSGALTQYLVGKTTLFDLIEIDRDLIAILQKKYADQATIHEADALSFDFHTLQPTPLRMIGNLPYNISTPLLFHLFASIDLLKDLHFLLQKEVVNRMSAEVGSSSYGRLSVMTQYFCHCDVLFDVGPQAFHPPPRVQSAFIRLIPQTHRLKPEVFRQFQKVVRDAFNQRRKTLQNSLKHFISADELTALNIAPTRRPQTLSVEEYIRISQHITVK